MWIDDFVRGRTVVGCSNSVANRPVDMLVTTLCAPLVDYMPGVRAAWSGTCPAAGWHRRNSEIVAGNCARGVWNGLRHAPHLEIGNRAALAGIPEQMGFVGEARFGLLNRWPWGEEALPA